MRFVGGAGDCADDAGLAGGLGEDDQAHGGGVGALRSLDGEGERRRGEIFEGADALQGADDGDVVELVATVLAGADVGGGHGIDEGGEEVGAGRCREGSEGGGDGMALRAGRGEVEGEFGLPGRLGDGSMGLARIVADELVAAIDDHLRGVDAVEAEARGVEVLAVGELVGGEAVMPAELVPVIDVLAEDDDVGGGDGLFVVEAGEEGVRGGTTGAALGGEELDEDRGAGLAGDLGVSGGGD